jgi:glycyl-tRNA synthetase
MTEEVLEKIVSLAKRRGFIFPGSSLYGGLRGTWDYGPMGVELKKNIKDEWWKHFVYQRNDVVGIDSAILMNSKVWEASGHLESFTDPLVECKVCHIRLRADHEDELKEHEKEHKDKKDIWTEPRRFNLLVEAELGVIEGEKQKVFLRGEITQGVQVNFQNVLSSTRVKIPFGIAQIGKAFRNEITPGNFTFRSREFEQFELQFYIKPDSKKGEEMMETFKKEVMDWYVDLGITRENLRYRQHEKDEMAHYAKDAWDLEYNSPFGGWKEFQGIHNRGDWDLSRHAQYSGIDLSYTDPETNEKYIPWDIELSGGVDRATLFFLIDAYQEDGKRVFLKLDPRLAPIKAAVFPLLANKPELVAYAQKVHADLKKSLNGLVVLDDRGNIGKRYFSQDEVGTPFCITVDFTTLEDDTVTVRDRDTATQKRVAVKELDSLLAKSI